MNDKLAKTPVDNHPRFCFSAARLDCGDSTRLIHDLVLSLTSHHHILMEVDVGLLTRGRG
jgi:hypothetical protein